MTLTAGCHIHLNNLEFGEKPEILVKKRKFANISLNMKEFPRFSAALRANTDLEVKVHMPAELKDVRLWRNSKLRK